MNRAHPSRSVPILFFATLAWALAACAVRVASAQGDDVRTATDARTASRATRSPRDEAKHRHDAAVAAFAHKRYRDSIRLFMEADELQPSALISYNIARAHDALHEIPLALASYRDYLRRAKEPYDGPRVQDRIAELSRQLVAHGFTRLTIASSPSGASVWVDGASFGLTPWTGELQPGEHTARLILPDHPDATRDFTLLPNQPLMLGIEFASTRPGASESLAAIPALSTPSETSREDAARPQMQSGSRIPLRASWKSTPKTQPPKSGTNGSPFTTGGLVALGTGATTLGGAVVFEVLRGNAEDNARNQTEQIKYDTALRTMQSRQSVARALAAAGGLAVLGGVALLIIGAGAGPDGEVDEPTHASATRVAMNCASAGCGLSVRGSY